MIVEIERDYIDCCKVIDLNEYRIAKKQMEDYAEGLFNDDNIEDIIEALTLNVTKNNEDLPF